MNSQICIIMVDKSCLTNGQFDDTSRTSVGNPRMEVSAMDMVIVINWHENGKRASLIVIVLSSAASVQQFSECFFFFFVLSSVIVHPFLLQSFCYLISWIVLPVCKIDFNRLVM